MGARGEGIRGMVYGTTQKLSELLEKEYGFKVSTRIIFERDTRKIDSFIRGGREGWTNLRTLGLSISSTAPASGPRMLLQMARPCFEHYHSNLGTEGPGMFSPATGLIEQSMWYIVAPTANTESPIRTLSGY